MVGEQGQRELFREAPRDDSTVVVNDRCLIRTHDGHRLVLVSGIVLAQPTVGDPTAEAHAIVSLVEQGWADQNDVARAFARSPRTVRRYQRRVDSGGLAALGRAGGYPRGRSRVAPRRLRLVTRLRAEGLSNRAIAQRVGVSEKVLHRSGWTPATAAQEPLPLPAVPADPNLSAFGTIADDPLPVSFDADPADRRGDRLLAYLGLLDDAAPLFRSGGRIPRAGVLLALPAVVSSGVFTIARDVYGSLGPAFYGLRTTIVALLLLALLRIKRPEGLKEHPPEELGRLLGLDRAPEVKTLRRKLSRLASVGRATEFGRALARRRVADRGAAMGFLYVDGHVRVYHGQRTLPKAHVARLRLSMPATTDYWVNDAAGDPLFVVTADANAGLVTMLPPVLEEVRGLVGERRVTIVFDRGGYSPTLFRRLITTGFDILTYRKGRLSRIARSRFQRHEAISGTRTSRRGISMPPSSDSSPRPSKK